MIKWLLLASLLSAAVSVNGPSVAATVTVDTLAPNSLVVTEYLANPVGVPDTDGEYFEVYNATGDTIDLAELVVADDGSNAFTVAAGAVAPGAFAVFASTDGTALGFAADVVYGGSMALTNGADEIGLYRPDGALIHKVAYDDGDGFGPGLAHELRVLDAATPTLVFGPAGGDDFVAATNPLTLDNFGSPGAAGNTFVGLPAVPVPASAWLFGSALAILGWARRQAQRFAPRR